ncbi:MAG TPA: hypothetical protein VIF12_07925 [Micavibrio sp.]
MTDEFSPLPSHVLPGKGSGQEGYAIDLNEIKSLTIEFGDIVKLSATLTTGGEPVTLAQTPFDESISVLGLAREGKNIAASSCAATQLLSKMFLNDLKPMMLAPVKPKI